VKTIDTPNHETKTQTGMSHPKEEPSASGSINIKGRAVTNENIQQDTKAFQVPKNF